jgi:hypothetical protein
VSWLALGVAAAAFALALLPTRRLFVAGWRPAPLAAYLLVLMALATSLLLFRAGIRVLLPILLVLYIAPFIGAPEVVARTITRLGAGRGGRGARGIVDGEADPAGAVPPQGRQAASPATPTPGPARGEALPGEPNTHAGPAEAPPGGPSTSSGPGPVPPEGSATTPVGDA